MTAVLRRRSAILVLMAALVTALWPVCKAAIASLYYFPASHALEQWQQSPDKPAETALNDAQQQIAAALHWQPENPHYQLVAAKIAEWAWYGGVLTTAAISHNEKIYQHAIALRPHWPVAYADYGYFLATVQQRLSDAWQQFALAERYGPYLPDVHKKILQVAFANWPELTVAQKATVFQRVANAMGGPLQADTIKIIQRYQQQRQQCIYLRKKLADKPVWPEISPRLCPAE